MVYLRKLGMLSLLLLLCSNTLFALKIESLSMAVNIAGKQRMYTQRLLKDYAMVGMKNSFGKPEADLKKIVSEFEDHMNSLHAFTKDDATKKSIEKSKSLWSEVKTILTTSPNKENTSKLQKDLEVLLKNADDTTKLFAKQTGKKSGEIINISGRQRMLSQRMASLYMLKVWGVNDPEFSKKMDDSMKLFKTSLQKLMKYEKNTPEIVLLLKKAQRSFKFFEFMNKAKNRFVPSLIYKKSNDILKNMNKATGLYVKVENS